ncbi:IclR family transcriptional regulator [Nocardioides zeae]|uniref:DNA-binding IclR family transcriptional regulator n=1 Tax=Nocardioides zeae TaxID=1457234 RepID=A0AAJ1U8G5_9ACTN|nr:IclR family transcriptional regulator [Nocardioides zeae]MDQ1105417.1 DNA-binding IclR family transcriptional regulator [Nocardioides zeae]
MAGNTRTPGTTVTQRIVALLGAFDEHHRRLSLTHLAERAGLAPPTAHRLAAELVAGGLLERRGDGTYAVGRRVWDLGLLAAVQTDLRAAAAPFLHDIYAATLATVHLAVREGTEVLYVERLSGRASVPIISTVGSRLPAHATGVGKVLLAHAPPAVVEEVVGAPLRRLTAYTVVQPGTLLHQLAAARRDGYATTVEEVSPGACSLAVPVRRGSTPDAPVVAALGVVVPSLKRDRPRLLASLRTAAAGISRSL